MVYPTGIKNSFNSRHESFMNFNFKKHQQEPHTLTN